MKYLLPLIILLASCGTAKINKRQERARIDSTGVTAFDFASEMEQVSIDTKKKDSAVTSLKIENKGIEVHAEFDTTGGGPVHVSVSDAGEVVINPGGGKVKNVSIIKTLARSQLDSVKKSSSDTAITHVKEFTKITKESSAEVRKETATDERKKDIKRGVLQGGIFAGIFIVAIGLIFYFRYKKETA